MLIKVKKNLRGLFLHQIIPFKLLGEKRTGKKFFLDHPSAHDWKLGSSPLWFGFSASCKVEFDAALFLGLSRFSIVGSDKRVLEWATEQEQDGSST